MTDGGWRTRITRGLARTRELLLTDVADLFAGTGPDESFLDRMEGAPHKTLLVLDAVTGQNALTQVEDLRPFEARAFARALTRGEGD